MRCEYLGLEQKDCINEAVLTCNTCGANFCKEHADKLVHFCFERQQAGLKILDERGVSPAERAKTEIARLDSPETLAAKQEFLQEQLTRPETPPKRTGYRKSSDIGPFRACQNCVHMCAFHFYNKENKHFGRCLFKGCDCDEYVVVTDEQQRLAEDMMTNVSDDVATVRARNASKKIVEKLGELSKNKKTKRIGGKNE